MGATFTSGSVSFELSIGATLVGTVSPNDSIVQIAGAADPDYRPGTSFDSSYVAEGALVAASVGGSFAKIESVLPLLSQHRVWTMSGFGLSNIRVAIVGYTVRYPRTEDVCRLSLNLRKVA